MANALRQAYPDGTVAGGGNVGYGNGLWTQVNNRHGFRMYHSAGPRQNYDEFRLPSLSFQLINDEVMHVELNWNG